MFVDYHLHSNYSFDGIQTIDDICMVAIERGIDEIAITEHMDIYSGKPYEYILNCEESFDALMKAKDKYKDKLVIRKGIELGQPMRNPEAAKLFLDKYQLDFVIGSIHNMENDIDVGNYDYNEINWDSFFQKYLDCVLDLVKNYDFDVLGHITYPARYLYLQTSIIPNMMLLKERFEEIFQFLIKREKGIELNTSSIARGSGLLMPTEELLKLYYELGGRIITIGSDAHVKEQTGITAKIGQEILKKNGFKEFSTYENRKVIMRSLE